MFRVLLALGLILTAACEINNQKLLPVSSDTSIIGGTEVAENTALASGIVGVYDFKDDAFCTATIIAENYILTAAHCGTTKSQHLKVIFGVDLDERIAIREVDVRNMYIRNVSRIYNHPKYNPNSDSPTDINDIAIMKFQGDLPPGYKPVKMLSDVKLLKKATLITIAGYGVSQVDFESVDPKLVKNIKDAVDSGEITCDDNYKNCLRLEMSGDGLLRVTKAPISHLYDTEFVLDESKGHGTCSGDSGGPAYLEMNGEYLLAGVTSRGGAACDDVGIYTNAVKFKDWIQEILKKQ